MRLFPEQPPAVAAAAGYRTKTFDSTFGASKIDKGNTKTSGFEWYPWSFFGGFSPGEDELVSQRTVGRLALTGHATDTVEVSTAAQIGGGDFVGTAFGGGGYFEAEVAFDPEVDFVEGGAHPAFWMMAIEHLAGTDETRRWPGQASGFAHFGEIDVFEYIRQTDRAVYLGNVHDW